MMKRIPKGTLKVTTSELDGLEPHERSKRTTYQKGPASTFTKGVRSLTSPPRTRNSDGPPNVVSPTSPPPSAGSQGPIHTFQFLRRPFGGGASLHIRKRSSSATKRVQQVDTCGSSDTSSNSSGVLGIAAPPSKLLANDLINSSVEAVDESVDIVSIDSTSSDEEPQVCFTRSDCPSPPTSGNPTDSSSPMTPAHLLGIARPIYMSSTIGEGGGSSNEDQLAQLYIEQESEIVFECSPDSSCSKRDKFTLFEQSWLSDSDEDIQLQREQRSPARERQRDVMRAGRRESQEHPPRRQDIASERALDDFTPSTRVFETSAGRTKASPGGTTRGVGDCNSKVACADAKLSLADASESVKIFVLLLQPHDKIFELIQLTYPREETTLQSIVEMIPGNATEPVLASQAYVGITRPRKRSPDFCDFTLTASDSLVRSANFHSIGLQHGEIVVALPKGFSHHELVRLAKKILSNARIQSLLERSSAKVEKTSKNVPSAPVQSNLDRQVTKDHVDGVKRAVAVASVANAAVSSPELEVPRPAKNSKKASSQKHLLYRFNEDIPSSCTSFPALSVRQRQAIKGIAKLSSASSVSSSSSRSSVSHTRRALAGLSKLRTESLLGATMPLYSSTSVSSSAAETPALDGCNDSLGIRIRSDDSLRTSHFTNRRAGVTPQTPVSFSRQSGAQEGPSKSPFHKIQGQENVPALATPGSSASSSVASSKSRPDSTARHSPTIVKPASGSERTFKSLSSECSTCDRSVRSHLSRRSAHSNAPRHDSFASFTQRAAFASTSRLHRQRARVTFASSLAWGLALLCMTMILRYYTDPTGYQAVRFHRNYNQPLGLLGGLQLFLLMHMLVKFQQSHLSGPTSASSAHQARVHTPTVSRGGRTPLLHRQSGARR